MSTLSADLRTLSREAFVYFYPLITMDITRLQAVNSPIGTTPGSGPPNRFSHLRAFPTADFRAVVRPNFDTLYSSAWLDLTAGPVKLSAPDTDDRYYMLPCIDMWTDVFANPGKRTTGTEAGEWVIVGPGYTGKLPSGLPVIAAPTPYVWIIGRTQTNGVVDYPAVHVVQDGYTITPLDKAPEHSVDADYDVTTEPLKIVNGMTALDYFAYAAKLLSVIPPHASDFSQLARIALLGIAPGKPFDASRFSADDQAELEAGKADALAAMTASLPTLGTSANGWNVLADNIGVYGNSYFKRAVVTLIGLGANPPEDAVYPLLTADAEGNPISGEHDYVIHFDADKLPPAYAFWSVTMYDADGYQVANELDRFAIGDRDRLTYNADGSLDLYLQHTNPGEERVANWLPAPLGPLGVTMRLYAPKADVLDGRWYPPAVRKVSAG
ncbi:DUF1254 domain-containing protein [Mycolicibacterium arenosum]|uniref:DUF1254 domain-containing protein n=1 Tax=Mycolicibacterium arenosum TaxID=2952157 RepID=A0ABT1LZ22_9MYCO|nr:DUF1254 domain-containing protein [Mycolicibacterium sp. CAU 1645]MCP9272149.1 DUF1254 domain-containing protein [Mycolicibacterium sp. CAU 1645]